MSVDLWKEFDLNPISHSVAHHLMAIGELHQKRGYARVSDVAKELNITRGSASLTLKALKEKGLVEEDDNRFLSLSIKGAAFVEAVEAKKELMNHFLHKVLGLSETQAAIDTCKIEHLIGNPTAERLADFIRFWESECPATVAFRKAWATYSDPCHGETKHCPPCKETCLRNVFKEVS